MPNHLALVLLTLFLSLPLVRGASVRTDTAVKPGDGGAAQARFAGHLLITPIKSKDIVLVDGSGREVHVWPSDREAGAGARLLPDGSILRIAVEKPAKTFRGTGLQGGRVQRIAWSGEVLWDFWNAATYHMVAGDALVLPNGNILMAVVEYKSQDDVLALGRDRDRVTFEGLYAPGLMEFEPKGRTGGRLVWRWSAWDHVCQDRHPGKAGYEAQNSESVRRWDVNALPGRGMMISSIDYHEGADLVCLTLPSLGEAWVVDHSTTLKESTSAQGGRHQLGGRPLARYRGTPQTLKMTPSRVLSAAFSAPSTAPVPGVKLLALRGVIASEATLTMEQWTPVIEGSPDGRTFGTGPVTTLQRWTEKIEKDLMSSLPTSWMQGDEDTIFVARRKLGRVSWMAQPPASEWDYANQRGMTMVVHSVVNPDAEVCCGMSADPTSAKQPVKGVRAPLMGTPRYYPVGHLSIHDTKTSSPKAVGEQNK